jgi:hypothetical protein
MKRALVIVCFILLFFPAIGQVQHQVISASGNYAVAGAVSVSWTLGETVIPTQQNGDVILTHGFQQQLIVSTIAENPELKVELTVYPNPVSDQLFLRFGSPAEEATEVFIMDAGGRLVKTETIEASVTTKEINMQDLGSGIYYIKLIRGIISNVYKVVKL